uniref:Reverse transcriptase Ty1/copia-type domain-containing protein n=1 Tax=Tanacetum cinerariifolium TaxID=118510 RepID=A0A6L2JYV0_TANCI|nr:hypothetical protein [Tanacetum cinerariifolium]
MTGNKAYLVEYQAFNGGPFSFGGSKGPKEANNSAGTQDNIDAGNSEMEADPAQEYFILPLWSSYTSTLKSSEAKNGAETLRKTFAQGIEKLLLQVGAARASSTNYVNTASPLRNVSAAGPSYPDLSSYANQCDSQIPSLEDIYEVPSDGIFTSESYDDEGAVADFTNLESTMNIEPKKISQAPEDESWVDAMQEELLQFKTQKVWILVYLPFGKKLIGTKWVYKNKKDERGVIVRNKARYIRGIIDKTLFKKKDKKDIMLKEDRIFISQDKYVVEILKKFDFMSVKTASTPIETQKPLVKYEEAADMDVHLYRSMIGSLIYLTASRPDIMYAVCACYRFQVTLKTSHLHDVKRIFRYLKGQPKLGNPQQTIVNFLEGDLFHGNAKSKQLWLLLLQRQSMLLLPTAVGDQTHETTSSSSPENTQSPKIVLKGTGRLGEDQTMEHIPKDSPSSGGQTSRGDEGELTLQDLLVTCTKLSKQVLRLVKDKNAQATKILNLKERVNKLEKRQSIYKHRYKLSECDFNKLDDLVDKGADYAVNEGRSTDKIKVLNAKAEGVSASGETLSAATLAVSTASVQEASISTARIVSTVGPSNTDVVGPSNQEDVQDLFDDETSIVDILVNIANARPRPVVITDPEQEQIRATPIVQLAIDPKGKGKGKGKGKMVEPEPTKELKKRDFDDA